MPSIRLIERFKNAFWIRWPVWLTAFSLLTVLTLLTVTIRERLAFNRVQVELYRRREAGEPIDNADLEKWFREHTFQEGTAAWNEILQLCSSITSHIHAVERLPYVGGALPPPSLTSGGEWPKEAEVAEFLVWVRPLIDRIDKATQYPTPVWQPIEFDGSRQSLLRDLLSSHEIGRLVQLEVEHALYHRDGQRAIRGLKAIRSVAAAFDWEFCVEAERVQLTWHSMHQNMIGRSLACDVWTQEQLQLLLNQLGPAPDTNARWSWQRVMNCEFALTRMDVAAISAGNVHFNLHNNWLIDLSVSTPSFQDHVMKAWRELEDLGAGGINCLTDRTSKMERMLHMGKWRVIDHLIFPDFRSFAAAYEVAEDGRRFARTTVGIKLYQQQFGHWPENLNSLERIGFSSDDWNTVRGRPFGYEVIGKEARACSNAALYGLQISNVPPQHREESSDVVTIIR